MALQRIGWTNAKELPAQCPEWSRPTWGCRFVVALISMKDLASSVISCEHSPKHTFINRFTRSALTSGLFRFEGSHPRPYGKIPGRSLRSGGRQHRCFLPTAFTLQFAIVRSAWLDWYRVYPVERGSYPAFQRSGFQDPSNSAWRASYSGRSVLTFTVSQQCAFIFMSRIRALRRE